MFNKLVFLPANGEMQKSSLCIRNALIVLQPSVNQRAFVMIFIDIDRR